MTPYIISLAIGILVGVIYALVQVKSPAPPVIALVGLFGILIGEQGVPLVKERLFTKKSSVSSAKVASTQITSPTLNVKGDRDVH